MNNFIFIYLMEEQPKYPEIDTCPVHIFSLLNIICYILIKVFILIGKRLRSSLEETKCYVKNTQDKQNDSLQV